MDLQHKAHGRPSSRKERHSFQSNQPTFIAAARLRSRSMEPIISADPALALCGTRRATASPCRVMTTSSPLFTRSSI
jgi:hypothetical protein